MSDRAQQGEQQGDRARQGSVHEGSVHKRTGHTRRIEVEANAEGSESGGPEGDTCGVCGVYSEAEEAENGRAQTVGGNASEPGGAGAGRSSTSVRGEAGRDGAECGRTRADEGDEFEAGGSEVDRYGGVEAGGARAGGTGGAQSGRSGVAGFGESGRGGAQAGGGDESAARRIALDALSRAARTRGQLEAQLQRKGIAAEAAAAVLDRFEEVGLIDDLDYAETFVESRHRVRGQGGRALSMELRRRGVAADVIAEAVGGLDPEREFETACRIAQSRYERMSAVPDEVKVRRLAGFLARKGYSGSIVARAVRYVVETADSSAGDAVAMDAAEALDGMGALEGMGQESEE